MTDKTKKDYEKPALDELGDDQGELSEKELDKISGGPILSPPPCFTGSQAVACNTGSGASVT